MAKPKKTTIEQDMKFIREFEQGELSAKLKITYWIWQMGIPLSVECALRTARNHANLATGREQAFFEGSSSELLEFYRRHALPLPKHCK